MDALACTHVRTHLDQTMEQVCDAHTPGIITRKDQRSVVVISLEDSQALEEAACLAGDHVASLSLRGTYCIHPSTCHRVKRNPSMSAPGPRKLSVERA